SGLLLLWAVVGGAIMFRLRDRFRAFFRRLPGDWRLKFVLSCTLLALIEEAVTTGMTDLAPLLGVKMGEVAITASADYVEVVTRHSVVVFVPMFVAWSLLLSRYRFGPASVFVLWGLTGTLAETITFGLQNLLMTGFWAFVYGLMVYLPSYAAPEERRARAPRWYHYPLAVVAPLLILIPLFIVAIIALAILHL
ncbi:MAG TPA: hypothetical protein VLT35_06005, partial [Methanocella sp.]|nr:hypothetical protein [Methanocella sp.]